MNKIIAMFSGISFIALGACSDGENFSVNNPNIFSGKITDGTMTGDYNPEGFASTKVQELLAQYCVEDRLGGYNETPAESGLVVYAATCAKGPKQDNVLISVTHEGGGEYSVDTIGF